MTEKSISENNTISREKKTERAAGTSSVRRPPLGYLGGDIMTFGSNLARQYEYDKFIAAGIPGDVYSPVQNKSINDKSNVTEAENNCLAEKITEADIERLWKSDYVVMCPEQHAIGSMCELGCLFGWHYMCDRLLEIFCKYIEDIASAIEAESGNQLLDIYRRMTLEVLLEVNRIDGKNVYAHYYDIRTNHINEKDWRRSFSINQLLYGMILACTADHTLHNSFDEIIPLLQEKYGVKHADE